MKRVVRVPMREGSMVLWDQRIPHGSTYVDRYENKTVPTYLV